MTDVIDRPLAACPDPGDEPAQLPGSDYDSGSAVMELEDSLKGENFANAFRDFMYLTLNAAVEVEEMTEAAAANLQHGSYDTLRTATVNDLIHIVGSVARGATMLLTLVADEVNVDGPAVLDELFTGGPRSEAVPYCLAELLAARRAATTGRPFEMRERWWYSDGFWPGEIA